MLAVGEHVIDGFEPRYAQVAAGLGGGVGGTQQEMCGALSGGVLLIGLLLGRNGSNKEEEEENAAGDLAAHYRERFLAELGATQCARLRETLVEAPGGLGSCDVLVERATRLLVELLAQVER